MLDIFLCLLGGNLILIKYRNRFRTLSDIFIGLFITAILLAIIETGFSWLNSGHSSPSRGYYSAPLYEPSPELGFKNKPNVRVQSIQFYDDQVVYDVTQITDQFGRRITPSRPASKAFILFMGGSYTFGWGVEDLETLPSQVAQLAPDYAVYNYGVNAYGTNHLLAKLEQDDLRNEITQEKGALIYTFIDGHVMRNIGTFKIHFSRGHHMPYYNHDLERQGTLISGRPFLSAVYGLMGNSQLVSYFGLDFPKITDEHYRFTGRIIGKAQQEFKRQFPDSEFYLLLFPNNSQRILPFLQQEQIQYLDYSQLLGQDAGYRIPHDGHPAAKAYKAIAEQIVSDLGLTALKR